MNQEQKDWKAYNWIDTNYHINNYKLKYCCKMLEMTVGEYHELCLRLGKISTTQKKIVDHENGKYGYVHNK